MKVITNITVTTSYWDDNIKAVKEGEPMAIFPIVMIAVVIVLKIIFRDKGGRR
jgi:hypothetical protein